MVLTVALALAIFCMISIRRSALLPKSAEQLFDLVNNVRDYPAFLQGCKKVEVLEESPDMMRAKLYIARAGVSLNFTTHNRMQRPQSIDMSLEEGPFKTFDGRWRIEALSPEAAKISLSLNFEMKHKLGAAALEKLVVSVAEQLVDDLSKRAMQLS